MKVTRSKIPDLNFSVQVMLFFIPLILLIIRCAIQHSWISGHDYLYQFIPWWEMIRSKIMALQLPWWDASIMTGYPVLADPQSALLYPFNWIFFAVNVPFAVTLIVIIHLVLGAIFTGYWCIIRGTSRHAAALAGIVFGYSGYFCAHCFAGHYTLICSAIWLPLILAFLDSAIRTHTPRHIHYSVFCLALQYLAGHPQTSFFTICAVIIYLPLLISKRRKIASQSRFVFVSSGVMLALIVCGPVFLSSELFVHSARSSITADQTLSSIATLKNLDTYILPQLKSIAHYQDSDKQFYEKFNYIGILPLILAMSAGVKRQPMLYTLAGLGFALSIFPDMSFLLSKSFIPLAGGFRMWSRGLLLTTVAISVLCGHGFDEMLNQKNPKTHTRYSVLFAVLILIFYLNFLSDNNSHRYEIHHLLGFVWGILIIIISVGWSFFRSRMDSQKIIILATSSIIFLDLLTVNGAFLKPESSDIKKLQVYVKNNLDNNILEKNYRSVLYTFPVFINRHREFGLSTIAGYRPLPLLRFQNYMNASNGDDFQKSQVFALPNTPGTLTKLAGVKYWIGWPVRNRQLLSKTDLEPESDNILIDKLAFPRAWFVANAAVVDKPIQALRFVSENFNELRNIVALEEAPQQLARNNEKKYNVHINYHQLSDEEVRIDLESSTNGYVVISNAYYPGWKAKIDNISTTVFRANYLFCAVRISSDSQTIYLKYEPGYRRFLLFLSFGSMIFYGWYLWRNRKWN
ncbi:YfhO family protein [bacterium]|nr:YfhO family protein [candidate division CSSED10-310 bacterium]